MNGKRLAILTLIAGSMATAAGAEAFASAHWKSKIELEGSPEMRGDGRAMPTDYEIWLKAGQMRMKANASGMTLHMLKVGDELYNWMDGQGMGMKMTAAANRRGRPSQDYVNQVDTIRAKGKKTGAETIDGHPCEIWEYTSEQGEKGSYWLATDLKNFPVKAIRETERGKVTYHNTDIEIPAKVSDDLFAVPKDIVFRDMGEMQRR